MRSLGRVREFRPHLFNTTRPRQNGRHFADDTFSFIFLYENCRIFYSILTELSSQGSNQQYSSNSADKRLVSNRRQAIIWTNHGLVYCHIHASLGSDEYIYPLFSNSSSLDEIMLLCTVHPKKHAHGAPLELLYTLYFAWPGAHFTNSFAVVPCAKFCTDVIRYNPVILKPICHRILIMIEKSFVKSAPDVDYIWMF